MSGTPLASGDTFYNSESLYWLSRIIYAESGNQPLEGKIAVGNVVLNRVAHPQFPNTVKGVIFQANQFTPVQNGSINRTPSSESVIAAKLCLDGANTAGSKPLLRQSLRLAQQLGQPEPDLRGHHRPARVLCLNSGQLRYCSSQRLVKLLRDRISLW